MKSWMGRQSDEADTTVFLLTSCGCGKTSKSVVLQLGWDGAFGPVVSCLPITEYMNKKDHKHAP